MSWEIKCDNCKAAKSTFVSNIVELIAHHIDADGWFVCSKCGKHGYIEKKFDLQEEGETWEPYLRGIIKLGEPDETYQPFVFMVSSTPSSVANNVWFSYYKDLRSIGGRLKLGYGPGGPPVLSIDQLDKLTQQIKTLSNSQ